MKQLLLVRDQLHVVHLMPSPRLWMYIIFCEGASRVLLNGRLWFHPRYGQWHVKGMAARVCIGRRKYQKRWFFFPSFLSLPGHHLFRSALDELAGCSGRGPEDDPRRLDTRSLLQFLRNSAKERSLAAAPADLLPACTVCQVKCEVLEHGGGMVFDLFVGAEKTPQCFAWSDSNMREAVSLAPTLNHK